MRKGEFVTFTVDKGTVALLAQLADLETEGNRSAAVRRLVREAAYVRGIKADPANVPAHEAQAEGVPA